MSESDQLKVQRAIESSAVPAKCSERAQDWAGYIAAKALGVDIGSGAKSDRSHEQEIERVKIRTLLKSMLKYSFLKKSTHHDKRNGRGVPIYKADNSIQGAT